MRDRPGGRVPVPGSRLRPFQNVWRFDYCRDYHAFWKLYGIGLPDQLLRKLCYQNALKLVPGIPRAAFTRLATGFTETLRVVVRWDDSRARGCAYAFDLCRVRSAK
jgi:hypothetical protein